MFLGVHVLDCLLQRVPESLRRKTKLTVVVECLDEHDTVFGSFETRESSRTVLDHRALILSLPLSVGDTMSLRFTIYKRSATSGERAAVAFATTESSLWRLLSASELRQDLILSLASVLDVSQIIARLRVGLQLFSDEAKTIEFMNKVSPASSRPSSLLPPKSVFEPPHVAITAASDSILTSLQDLAVALDWHAPGQKAELLLPVLTFVEFVRSRVSATAANEMEVYLNDRAVGAAADIMLIFSTQGMTDCVGVFISSAMVFVARRLKIATGATRDAEEKEISALFETVKDDIGTLENLRLQCEELFAKKARPSQGPLRSPLPTAPTSSFVPEVESDATLVCLSHAKQTNNQELCNKAIEAFGACVSTRSLVNFERRLKGVLLSNDENSEAWRTMTRLKAALPTAHLLSGSEEKEDLAFFQAASEHDSQNALAILVDVAAKAEATAEALSARCAEVLTLMRAVLGLEHAAVAAAPVAAPVASGASGAAALTAVPTAVRAPVSAAQLLAAIACGDRHFLSARETAPDMCLRWMAQRDLVVILGLLFAVCPEPTGSDESVVLLEALAACSPEVADAPVLLFGAFLLLDDGERSATSFLTFAFSLSALLGTQAFFLGAQEENKAEAEISLLSHAYRLIRRCSRGMRTKVMPSDAEIAKALDSLPALEGTLDIVNGRTLLHLAAECRAAPLVRILVQRGKISPLRRDIYALTAPELARGDTEILGSFFSGDKQSNVMVIKKKAK